MSQSDVGKRLAELQTASAFAAVQVPLKLMEVLGACEAVIDAESTATQLRGALGSDGPLSPATVWAVGIRERVVPILAEASGLQDAADVVLDAIKSGSFAELVDSLGEDPPHHPEDEPADAGEGGE